MSAIMNHAVRRAACRVPGGYGRVVQRRFASEGKAASEGGTPLQKGAKRDPELYILLAVMSGAFGLAGLYFGRKPTAASSESKVSMAEGTMPWQTEGTSGKYQYHPGGDKSKGKKDAPSALNTVIVPNVNLPKHLHDQFNKWGKDGY